MNPWSDGLQMLTQYAGIVLAILLMVVWGMFIVRQVLVRLYHSLFSEIDLTLISMAGWVVPVLFLSLFTFICSLILNATNVTILVVSVILITSLLFARTRLKFWHALALLTLLVVSLVLRLAFLKDLVLPSYFDSAEHYRLITALADVFHTGILIKGSIRLIYHLGFHLLSAFVVHFLHINSIEFMLVFGQVLLAILPFTFFYIMRSETNSIPAAIFACLLAGIGFHMPAHLMNWGKYPALLGLVSKIFVFDLVYLLCRSDTSNKRRTNIIILCCAIFISVFIHSRTLVIYILMSIAMVITLGWGRWKQPYRLSSFILLSGWLIVISFFIYKSPTLAGLFSGYFKNDSWNLGLVLFLAIASSFRYPKQTFFLILWFVLCEFALLVPINLPFHLGTQTLLDRPFLQMFFYVMLIALGGLGFAALLQWTHRLVPDLKWIRPSIIFLLFGFVLLNAALRYSFYPSECCRFANRDDLAAFTWMDAKLPHETTILIASTGLQVTSFEASDSQTGVDGGIWISPLLSRKVIMMGYVQFDKPDFHILLCNSDIDYIYVGSTTQSFDSRLLDKNPAWYAPSLSLPSARVYQVLGCEE